MSEARPITDPQDLIQIPAAQTDGLPYPCLLEGITRLLRGESYAFVGRAVLDPIYEQKSDGPVALANLHCASAATGRCRGMLVGYTPAYGTDEYWKMAATGYVTTTVDPADVGAMPCFQRKELDKLYPPEAVAS